MKTWISTKWRSWGRAKKTIVSALLIAPLAYTGVAGFAHSPKGRFLLPYLGISAKAAGCPMGTDKETTPEKLEASRRREMAKVAAENEGQAVKRPALGFVLTQTKKSEIKSWAEKLGVECKDAVKGATMDCANVPGSAFKPALAMPIETVYFQFDPEGTLVALDAQTNDDTGGEKVIGELATLESAMTDAVGAPTEHHGERTRDYFDAPFRHAGIGYRYKNYTADLTAMSLPNDRVLLRAKFRSVPD